MASAKMTLIGMYNYDNTLFANMTFPEGIEKNDVINALLLQGGEFEVLYPRPEFMKYAIGAWSVKWERTFAEWLRGTEASWNPIHNYDRIEDIRDEHRGTHAKTETADYTDARTANLTDERTANLSEERTADLTDERTADLTDERTADLEEKTTLNNTDTNTQLIDGTTEHEVAAYNSSAYQPSSKDTISNGKSEVEHTGDVTVDTTGTDTMTHTGTDTTTHTGTDTTATTGTDTMTHTGTDNTRHAGTLSDVSGTDNYTDIHTAHMYGNIGVTTSASMLSEFYKISEWNLLEHICDVFISELLIPVY